MLKKILVKNYILIDNLELNFDEKLNIITGETGAGKSILIGAIDAVFASKVSKDVIKTGTDKSYIELTVDINDEVINILKDNSFEVDDKEIIISREITPSVSKYRINGTLVNADLIKIIREHILDIHSQHQAYTFMQPKYHINLLDSYAKSSCEKLFDEYSNLYSEYINLNKQLDDAQKISDMTDDKIEFLKFQIDEIESAQIQSDDEDEQLEKELAVLENAEKLKELTGSVAWNLNNDDESILSALANIQQNLSKSVRYDETLEQTESDFIEAVELLKNVSSSLRDYSQSLDNDTERLNSLQERLFLLEKLKRKYGNNISGVLRKLEEFQAEYSSIEQSSDNIEKLKNKINDIHNNLISLAKEISTKRKMYAEVLSGLIIDKLEKLELPKVKFEIAITPTELNYKGADNVEFLISTNISEPLKPLAKVASGGEISRVMLALKTIFAQHDNIDTVIFDEIDTGISGKTSQSVSDEIIELSNSHQIIMITHQAIIASKANEHIYVKKVQSDSTQVGIYVLNENDKICAIAELASGEITDKSVEFAKTLIKQ